MDKARAGQSNIEQQRAIATDSGPIKDFQVALIVNVSEHLLFLFYHICPDIFFVPSNFDSRPKPCLAICFPSPVLSVHLNGDGQLCFGHTQPRCARVRGRRHVIWVGGTERIVQAGLRRISRHIREGGQGTACTNGFFNKRLGNLCLFSIPAGAWIQDWNTNLAKLEKEVREGVHQCIYK